MVITNLETTCPAVERREIGCWAVGDDWYAECFLDTNMRKINTGKGDKQTRYSSVL